MVSLCTTGLVIRECISLLFFPREVPTVPGLRELRAHDSPTTEHMGCKTRSSPISPWGISSDFQEQPYPQNYRFFNFNLHWAADPVPLNG